MALQLVNNTGTELTDFTISYTGEQWRQNQSGPDGALNFAYSTDATSVLGTGTWTDFDSLDFQIPQVSTGTPVVLDGNAAANRTALSATISGLNVAVGETIWLRWANDGAVNNGHYIGIDDLSVTAVPEPSTYALGLGLLALGFVMLRRRRRD